MTTIAHSQPKVLHIILWIAQSLLAAMFLMAGLLKTVTPIDRLVEAMPFAAEAPVLIRFIGVCELLGAVGLVLPAALRVKPGLTILAAAGIGTIMLLSVFFHLFRGEYSSIIINIVLGLIAALIVWGRSTRAKITSA